MANGPSKLGLKQKEETEQENSLIAQFEQRMREVVNSTDLDDDDAMIRLVYKFHLPKIAVAHMELALYCESPQAQLAAIKEYYNVIREGFQSKNISVKDAPNVTAESIISAFMNTDKDGNSRVKTKAN